MSLPASHPFRAVGATPTAPGSFTRRGLVQWSTPNNYTRLAGTAWSAQLGNAFTGSVTPGIATTAGGYNVLDLSTGGNVSQSVGLTITGAVTLDMWVWISNTTAATGAFLTESSANTYGDTTLGVTYLVGGAAGNQLRFIVGATVFDTSFRSSVWLDQWHHLTLVVPGTGTQTCVGYWNGLPAISQSTSVTRPGTSFFSVNRRSTGLRGLIGDLKVYSVALDASEVRQNYNALAPYYGRLPIV